MSAEAISERVIPGHVKWDEFRDRLAGPEGCDWRKDGTWLCGGGTDRSKAERILRSMGATDDAVAASLEYYTEHGGHCDCEILLNVDPGQGVT